MLPIYIDNIAFYLQKSGGITVVWKEIIKRLFNFSHKVTFLNYKKEPQNIFYDEIKNRLNIKYLRLFNIKIQRYLPVSLRRINKPFIFHSTYYRYSTNPHAINITTIHDFTYEYYTSGLIKKIHCWQKYRAIKKSHFVICISENTKNDLLKFCPKYNKERIRVIYNGVSNDYFPINHWNKKTIPYDRYTYLLFVGARDSYKNFDFIIKSLKDCDFKLVIVGPNLKTTERDLLNRNQINFYYAGRVSNEDLNILYNGAFALVYPSSYEGFGIPILEAQKAGCPVIAYNSSSIPEVMGDNTLLMNTLSTDELINKLTLLSINKIRKSVVERGLINARKFDWDKTSHEIINLYKEAEQCILQNNPS